MKQNHDTSMATGAQPGDRRYRNSHYFLQDQLRCSEALADFRTVREWLGNTALQVNLSSLKVVPALVAIRIGGRYTRSSI